MQDKDLARFATHAEMDRAHRMAAAIMSQWREIDRFRCSYPSRYRALLARQLQGSANTGDADRELLDAAAELDVPAAVEALKIDDHGRVCARSTEKDCHE